MGEGMMEKYFGFIEQDLRGGMSVVFGCLVLIGLACLMDMWIGIDAARANKEPIRSRPLRKTGAKMVDYYRLVMFFLLIDLLGLCFPWWSMPYATVACTAGVLVVEGLSIVENLRRKRSHAAEVAGLAAEIVECISPEEAKKIIGRIKERQGDKEKAKG